jgi:hypothetical protein
MDAVRSLGARGVRIGFLRRLIEGMGEFFGSASNGLVQDERLMGTVGNLERVIMIRFRVTSVLRSVESRMVSKRDEIGVEMIDG